MTSKLPVEIQTFIDKHVNAFNAQDIELFLKVFGDDAIIIDGIAPYRWLNPNAPANWLDDVEKWREAFQVTSEHLSYEMGFSNVEGSNAYAVVSATLMVTIKGQTAARTGTLAYTFSKHGDAKRKFVGFGSSRYISKRKATLQTQGIRVRLNLS